ncbi:tetratricopeptide repeat protein [Nocardia rosealba]|uniref:tetratricopeptide repeat protein n=1 Tax=Nocardia rosealba TaxID=2878563 RepID=UPI001CD9D195|nr:tetratricopeptide repeat protein [Nocardia rosealba]MCA2208228.1 tetratricopeptide repeat protein [Nocardia rosealba]
MTVEGALERARAARRIGRVEEARRVLGTALAQAHDDPDVLVELAGIAYDSLEFDKAPDYARQAAVGDPESAGAHEMIAKASAARGDWDTAFAHGDIVVRLFPDEAFSWLLLAWLRAFGAPRDEAGARAALSEAIALSPEDVEVHRSAAVIYARLRDRDAARRHRAAGLEIDPTQPELLYLQARSEFTLSGSRTAAVATLRSLLAQTPAYASARLMLAEICWRAMMRLAAWVWVFAGCAALVGIWGRPWLLWVLTVIFIVVLVRAWTGVCGTLRGWTPQPAVSGALSAVLGIVLLTFLIEWIRALLIGWIRALRLRRSTLRKDLEFALVSVSVAAVATAALFSGGREIDVGVLRSRDVVNTPAPSQVSPSTVPVAPPTLVRLPTVPPAPPQITTPRAIPRPPLYAPSYFRLPTVGQVPIVTPER